jgi:hypothetical protein
MERTLLQAEACVRYGAGEGHLARKFRINEDMEFGHKQGVKHPHVSSPAIQIYENVSTWTFVSDTAREIPRPISSPANRQEGIYRNLPGATRSDGRPYPKYIFRVFRVYHLHAYVI